MAKQNVMYKELVFQLAEEVEKILEEEIIQILTNSCATDNPQILKKVQDAARYYLGRGPQGDEDDEEWYAALEYIMHLVCRKMGGN